MSRTATSLVSPARRSRGLRPSRALVGGALVLALLLAACGSDDELGGKVVKDGLGCTVTQVDRKTSDVPTVEAGTKVGKKTTTTDLVKAESKACASDSSVYVTLDLVGATAKDAKVFSDTWKDERPVTARLGQGQLIAGLETGLKGMKVGGRRQIAIPSAEAYGKDGNAAQGIGKNEDLVFVVDLVAVTESPLFCNAASNIPKGTKPGKPTEVKMPLEAPVDEVTTTVLEEGDGPKATKKSYLTVEYLGVSCASGQQFDSSWDNDDPITIAMADATPTDTAFSVIPGWTEGLLGQKQGSTVQLEIPYEDAYGAAGKPPAIGTSDPLVFIVQIVKVSDKAPPSPTTTTTAAPEATTTMAAAK